MSPPRIDRQAIPGPVILAGDEHTAYRDPLLHYHEGLFRLFCSVVRARPDGNDCFHVGVTESRDLRSWGPLRPITDPDDPRSFCGPGGIVRHDGRWVLCLSSYPRPDVHEARCWTMASADLQHWQEPRVLQLKGPAVPVRDTGLRPRSLPVPRQGRPGALVVLLQARRGAARPRPRPGLRRHPIPPDSLLLQSMQLSFSRDLEHWTPYAQSDGEENYCVLVDQAEDEYVLVHSPANGIGIKRSTDLVNWYDECLYTLGQRQWPWAQGRITAGHLLDLRRHPTVGKYLLTFHGATPRGRRERAHHGAASIGIAWSKHLMRWHWPGAPEQGDADAAAAPCACVILMWAGATYGEFDVSLVADNPATRIFDSRCVRPAACATRTTPEDSYMALIEHLERDGWEEFFRGIFQYTLEVMKHDRFRSVGSSADDLRSWLGMGGVSRVREHLDDQMEMRGFSPSRRAAVRDCLEQLVRENRRALLDLTTTGVIPAGGQVRTEAVGVSETDVRDLLNRMIAGERPFEDWMHAHGRSDEEIAEIYKLIDEWLMQKGIIPPPPPTPGLN